MPPDKIARRFSDLAAWIECMIGFDMQLVRYYREHHGVNTFLRSTKVDEMGGLPKQAYYDGIHEIDDDEALIVETALPERVRYWQMLVADDRFCTIDWVNRQSSINDAGTRRRCKFRRHRAPRSRRAQRLPSPTPVGRHPDAVEPGQRRYPIRPSKVPLADGVSTFPGHARRPQPSVRAAAPAAAAQLRRIW
jgi:hypothetical protein